MKRYIIKIFVAIAALTLGGHVDVQAGTEIAIVQQKISITITNGFMGCFSVKNISTDIDNMNIHIIFDYTDYDPEYESEQHNPLVDSSSCLCNLRDPQTRGWFVVFPHVNAALKNIRNSPSPHYGKLNNIPDMKKFSSLKTNPPGVVFDSLPKHEVIMFPLKYINGILARYYYVQLFCN